MFLQPLIEMESIGLEMYPFYERQVSNKLRIYYSELQSFLKLISSEEFLKGLFLGSILKLGREALKL